VVPDSGGCMLKVGTAETRTKEASACRRYPTRARFADHDEVFEAGDAFYLPPGHVGVQNEPGTEYVQFSPTKG
jgi:ribosomal protein L16 Arg81 hydroxylase